MDFMETQAGSAAVSPACTGVHHCVLGGTDEVDEALQFDSKIFVVVVLLGQTTHAVIDAFAQPVRVIVAHRCPLAVKIVKIAMRVANVTSSRAFREAAKVGGFNGGCPGLRWICTMRRARHRPAGGHARTRGSSRASAARRADPWPVGRCACAAQRSESGCHRAKHGVWL